VPFPFHGEVPYVCPRCGEAGVKTLEVAVMPGKN
jgi:hypothetical protein